MDYIREQECWQRIRKGLEMRKMTQADLCEKTGISKSSMSQYVNGHRVPRQIATHLIAKALDVSEGWLMGLNMEMERVEHLQIDTTPDERELLDLYRQLDKPDRREVQRYIKYLLSGDKYQTSGELLNA